MIQNSLQGTSGNRKEKSKYHSSGYYKKGLKRKWLSKQASSRNIQYKILKSECHHRGTKNVCLEIRRKGL